MHAIWFWFQLNDIFVIVFIACACVFTLLMWKKITWGMVTQKCFAIVSLFIDLLNTKNTRVIYRVHIIVLVIATTMAYQHGEHCLVNTNYHKFNFKNVFMNGIQEVGECVICKLSLKLRNSHSIFLPSKRFQFNRVFGLK